MLKNFKKREEIMNLQDFKIFDVRFRMDDLNYGRNIYEKNHCKTAAFLDLSKDLSSDVKTHGGRHPLPETNDFQEKLRRCGLNHHQKVLIYDDGDNMAAARLWWMLKYYGLTEVFILSGGFKTLKSTDLTDEKEVFSRGNIVLKDNSRMVATYDEIKQLIDLQSPSKSILVDSRGEERYLGIIEPIDSKKGHIPGALNIPYQNHFNENGELKNLDILKDNFNRLEPRSDVIFYCGSGVTACSNILALDELGINSRLYPGSFSDYISYDDNQVVSIKA